MEAEPAKAPEKVEEKAPEKSPEEKPSDDDFKFDEQKYRDMGIEDEKILAEMQKKDRQIFEKQKVIDRQGKTNGDLKLELKARLLEIQNQKASLESKTELSDEEYNELHSEDPAKAARKLRNTEEAKAKMAELTAEEKKIQDAQYQNTNREMLMHHFNEVETLIEPMVEILKKDVPAEQAERVAADFRSNPFAMNTFLLFQLAKRTKVEKELATTAAKVKELEEQVKSAPSKALSKVKSITESPVKATAPGTSKLDKANYSSIDILTASPEQLAEMMKQIPEDQLFNGF